MHRNFGRTPAALTAALLLIGATAPAPSMKDIIDQSPKSDWQTVDPANTLVMELASGRVVIVLAPEFAPNTVANIKTLVREHYFDGAAVVRAQDNYVVQWARTDNRPVGAAWKSVANPALPGARTDAHPMGPAKMKIAAEFDRPIGGDLNFTPLRDPDTYASETGFSNGFPAARAPKEGRIWLAHCYGMVGVGRDNDADSGNGQELYAVIGQSPRNLDRNVTLVGRVVDGMELLSTMPRGTAALGFYEKPQKPIPIKSIRLASDMKDGPAVTVLRTDSATFAKLIEERRTRPDPWYKHSPQHIGVCNVPLPAIIVGFLTEPRAADGTKLK